MKFLMFLLIPTMVFADFTDEGYVRKGGPFELPIKFTVKADTVVTGAAIPTVHQTKRTIQCSLKKGQSFILGLDESVTVSYKIGAYLLKKNHTFQTADEKGKTISIQLKAGEAIDDLSYMGEGFCDIRVRNKIYSGYECFMTSLTEDKLEKLSALIQEGWVKTKCAGGKEAWLPYGELIENKNLADEPQG
jgi:hypothetical protein